MNKGLAGLAIIAIFSVFLYGVILLGLYYLQESITIREDEVLYKEIYNSETIYFKRDDGEIFPLQRFIDSKNNNLCYVGYGILSCVPIENKQP